MNFEVLAIGSNCPTLNQLSQPEGAFSTVYLDRYDVLVGQIAELERLAAQALQAHQEAVVRLAAVPGFGPDSAQQVMAEVGVRASSFPSAGSLAAWVGTCPGEDVSAEENHSTRSPKGNR